LKKSLNPLISVRVRSRVIRYFSIPVQGLFSLCFRTETFFSRDNLIRGKFVLVPSWGNINPGVISFEPPFRRVTFCPFRIPVGLIFVILILYSKFVPVPSGSILVWGHIILIAREVEVIGRNIGMVNLFLPCRVDLPFGKGNFFAIN